MNTTTNSNVCIVQPFGDRLELYIASSFSYGLGLCGAMILVRKILAEFSEANRNKRTIFSMFTAWIQFLVSSSVLKNDLIIIIYSFYAIAFCLLDFHCWVGLSANLDKSK